ncbi:branched-chain amino acid transport system II carrier protein, partial [Clostridium perfringens]
VVAFACLTTAIGLTSVTSKYFEDVTNKKLKYNYIVIFICVFSAIISNFGVDKIISISAPILTIIYPVSIVLILMNYFRKIFTRIEIYKGAAYATLLSSLFTVVYSLCVSISFVHKLPLDSFGFNWVLPAVFG